jgi:transposase
MEACGGAHYWAREIAKQLGHEVKLMTPRFVRAYVKSSKNDARDAEAICEAVARPSMRFVAPKSQSQKELALHRIRSLPIREHTALMNQMRGLLAESSIVVALGAAPVRRALAEVQGERDARVSELLREALVEMVARLRSFAEQLKRYDQQIAQFARNDPRADRLMTVPGVGPVIATALLATVGDARQFRSGRELSAWLGLVPREHSSGERTILLGISKRGDTPDLKPQVDVIARV